MQALWKKLRWSITQRGLLGTLKAALKALLRGSPVVAPHPFDQRYGTDTSGVIGGGYLATGHPHDLYITGYGGIAPSRFEAALDRWRDTIGPARIEDYTFIDLGCGKGRALLLASRLPFREVIGIELNPQLAAIAQRNAEHWQSLGEGRSRIRILVGDATAPALPAGPTLLFFYNSFAKPLVHRLAGHLSCHQVDLIYQNPDFAEAFTPQLGYREVWHAALPLSAEDTPAESGASAADLTILFRTDAAKMSISTR